MASSVQPVRFGDGLGLGGLDDVAPEAAYVLNELERAPSGQLEDSTLELLQNGHAIFRGEARAVVAELAKLRAYTPIDTVGMQLTTGLRLIYRHRDPGDVSSPLVWRSDEVT